MRVIVTADLHYNIARSRTPTQILAERICRLHADALVIAGDTCGQDLGTLHEALSLFEGFSGRRMLIPGNHCLWTSDGQTSRQRYERLIPDIAAQHGFDYLDAAPVVVGRVAFVGTVGWYDYSFRCPQLDIPLRFYENKIGPGAAALLQPYHHLLESTDDLRHHHLQIRSRWMDGKYVRLDCSDADFTDELAAKMRRHIHTVRDRVSEIVVAIHHVPIAGLVVRRNDPQWDFANAFMGSDVFERVLAEEPKVRHCVCGHTHSYGRLVRGSLTCTSIGSTYKSKRYEILEVGSEAG